MKKVFGEVRIGVTEQRVSSSYFDCLDDAKNFLEGWYKNALYSVDAIFAYARVVSAEGVEMFYDPRREVWMEI